MILKNAQIVLENEIINNGYVIIKDKKIVEIGKDYKLDDAIDLENNFLLPGFIDCHTHGGYGVDFEQGDQNRFKIFADNIVKEGITRYVQSTVTNDDQKTETILKEFSEFMKLNNGKAKCIGAHLEGPFISKFKKGAHQENLLKDPDIKLVEKWNEISNNNVKIITYAPELDNTEFTKYLLKNNIIPSAGHSNIKTDQFESYCKLGVKHITHLFNAMSGVDHHNPGLVVSAFNHKDILCEIITDTIHLKPEIIKLVYDHKTADNICLITDSISAKGLDDGVYQLGNLKINKSNNQARLVSNNALAGSVASYDQVVRNFKNITNISLIDLIKTTSINISKQLNIYSYTGSIQKDKYADLVVLDKDFNVLKTIVEGKLVFEKSL
ncbi:N-acetylglucosamine-6-phosphate deacetylase [Mycoplasma sp. HU2014]|uniref:N-acetylglucosamine-6-phosphate deacetylase n=1 Tax=Mycoplasma sp. HU2014 TaxID=1664275 RepID=UPI00067A82E1|nr:N-acetylglucosamine-6-phosphate deacetylase [Mycoplasma sp. HU2014]KNG79375.1 N-acetylglucosamine-6-phosphate deacetylase [Mycoplasma sp. HU2014]